MRLGKCARRRGAAEAPEIRSGALMRKSETKLFNFHIKCGGKQRTLTLISIGPENPPPYPRQEVAGKARFIKAGCAICRVITTIL